MVNSAYINRVQLEHLNRATDDLHGAQQKDYNNPDTGFAYKAPTWDKLDVREIREIIDIERAKSCSDAEAIRLQDIAGQLSTVINILDGIQTIVVKVQEELSQYDSNNRLTRLDGLRRIGDNALKSVISLCNLRSSNGDYVLSGSQIRMKPLDEHTLNYQGGTNNISLNLEGQFVGEINIRADNVAITSILSSLKKIAIDKNVVPNVESGYLVKAFDEIVRLRLEAAMLLQKVEFLENKYQIDHSNLLTAHERVASQNDTQYATKLQEKEHAYNRALEITRRFQEIFD